MNINFQKFSEALEARRASGLFRRRRVVASAQGPEIVLDGRKVLSFCSNDYLGLANHPDVVSSFKQGADTYGVGSGASHLVSGHSTVHQELEEELAVLTGRSRALLFSSGYMANIGVVSTLAGKGDRVFEDRLNHASLLEGGLFSGARFRRYPHLDIKNLAQQLRAEKGEGNSIVVTDGVFSMDGDMVSLPELVSACSEAAALLVVDDAHGFGCLGKQGTGTVGYFQDQGIEITQQQCQVLTGTLGKALGTSGAFVSGSEELIETLIQFCRPYIYTTAMPPAVAEATRTSLKIMMEESWRREKLQDFIRRFRAHCLSLGFRMMASATPIQAVVMGDAGLAVRASELLLEKGVYVTAIRPPTVPEGTARLRFTFSAAHDEEQFLRLLDAVDSIGYLAREVD